MPEDVVFKTEPQIALGQISAEQIEGVPRGESKFRKGLTKMGLVYAVGVQSTTRSWPPGVGLLPP